MKTIKVRRSKHAEHCWRSKDELINNILLWTPSHGRAKQDDQLEPIYNSSVPIQDVACKNSQERWTTDMGDERGSGGSVLAARHHDDVDIYISEILPVP